MLIVLALLGSAFGADCAAPTTPQEMETHIDDALLAFATLDEEGVYTAADQATHDLECMGEPLSKDDAAAYHRVVGIQSFMRGESDAALVAFQAARVLEPGYRLSTKIAPEGGKLARLWESAATAPDDTTITFRPPAGASARVDGVASNQYLLESPVVLQYVDSRGDVLWTGYIRPGEKPPKEIPAAAAAVAVAAEEEEEIPLDEELGDLGELEDLDDLSDGDEELAIEPEPEGSDIVMLDDPEPEPTTGRNGKPEEEPLDMDLGPSGPDREEGGKKGGIKPVFAAAIGTGAATAVAFGLSAGMRASFDNEPTAGKYHTTNATFYTSMGLAAATIGLTVTGFVVEF